MRDELVRALLEVPDRGPWTVFVSSHDVDEIERLADRVGFLRDGRLVFAERIDALLARFRLIEVVMPDGSVPQLPAVANWIPQGASGRTLRFIDTQHGRAESGARIASTFPGAAIVTTPLALRDVFVALARQSSGVEAV